MSVSSGRKFVLRRAPYLGTLTDIWSSWAPFTVLLDLQTQRTNADWYCGAGVDRRFATSTADSTDLQNTPKISINATVGQSRVESD